MILCADDILLSGKGRVCEPAHMRHSGPDDLPGLVETAVEREGEPLRAGCTEAREDFMFPGRALPAE